MGGEDVTTAKAQASETWSGIILKQDVRASTELQYQGLRYCALGIHFKARV